MSGSADDNARTPHGDDFGVYLPLLELGIGVEFTRLQVLGNDSSISISYHFGLANLGISTDTSIRNDPGIENGSTASFRVNYVMRR